MPLVHTSRVIASRLRKGEKSLMTGNTPDIAFIETIEVIMSTLSSSLVRGNNNTCKIIIC